MQLGAVFVLSQRSFRTDTTGLEMAQLRGEGLLGIPGVPQTADWRRRQFASRNGKSSGMAAALSPGIAYARGRGTPTKGQLTGKELPRV